MSAEACYSADKWAPIEAEAVSARIERGKERAAALALKFRSLVRRGEIRGLREDKRRRPSGRRRRSLLTKADAASKIGAAWAGHLCRREQRRRARAACCAQKAWRGSAARELAARERKKNARAVADERERAERGERLAKFQKELDELRRCSGEELRARYQRVRDARMNRRLEALRRLEERRAPEEEEEEAPVREEPSASYTEFEIWEHETIDEARKNKIEESTTDERWLGDPALNKHKTDVDRLDRLYLRFKGQQQPGEEVDKAKIWELYWKFSMASGELEARRSRRERRRALSSAAADLVDAEEFELPRRPGDLEFATRAHESALKLATGKDEWYAVRTLDGREIDIREARPPWLGGTRRSWDEDEASKWWFAYARKRAVSLLRPDADAIKRLEELQASLENPPKKAAVWREERRQLVDVWTRQILNDIERERFVGRRNVVRAAWLEDRATCALLIQKTFRGFRERAVLAARRKRRNVREAIDALLIELADVPKEARRRVVSDTVARRLLEPRTTAAVAVIKDSPSSSKKKKKRPAPIELDLSKIVDDTKEVVVAASSPATLGASSLLSFSSRSSF